MSRLYDALKEAGTFRKSAQGKAVSEVWDALGIHEQVLPDPDVAETSRVTDPDVAETGTVAGVTMDAVIPEAEPLEGDTVQPDQGLGSTIQAALDEKARLIPHAVNPAVAEHYRSLRTKILQAQSEKPFRSLVVASANPQEGKTVTVLNLGLSFAMLPSFKVLIVDGDMGRGTVGKWLGVDAGQPGLSNLIDGSARIEDVVFKSDTVPMHFIVRGTSKVHDLYSSELEHHIRRLTEQYDLVLVDTPPVNLMADVQMLAASCDAILLVARAFSTSRKALARAVEELRPFRVIGTVLNASAHKESYRYYKGGTRAS